jgi:branched-chain amino acid transport system permease protein
VNRLRRHAPYPAIGLLALIALVVPLLLPELSFYMQLVLSAIVVTGLSIFMGYAGQAALGQGAFVAVGALCVAVAGSQWHLPPVVGLVAAPIVSAALAALLGWPLLRLRGHYLAFGTLAVLFLVQLAMQTVPLFGSGLGIGGIPPLFDAPIKLRQLIYVYVAVVILILAVVVSHHVVASRFGRGIRALSGSESAAASAGVPVLGSKIKVFALAASFAALAGALTALWTPFVSQDSFPTTKSFEYVIMAVLGGLGSLWGGVIGAVIVAALLQALNLVASAPGMPAVLGPTLQYAGYGLVLVLVLLFMPDGIAPTIAGAWRRRRGSLAADVAARQAATTPAPRQTQPTR